LSPSVIMCIRINHEKTFCVCLFVKTGAFHEILACPQPFFPPVNGFVYTGSISPCDDKKRYKSDTPPTSTSTIKSKRKIVDELRLYKQKIDHIMAERLIPMAQIPVMRKFGIRVKASSVPCSHHCISLTIAAIKWLPAGLQP